MILCGPLILLLSAFKLLLRRMDSGLFVLILEMILPGKKGEAITIIEGLPFVRFYARPFQLGVIDSSQLFILQLKNQVPRGCAVQGTGIRQQNPELNLIQHISHQELAREALMNRDLGASGFCNKPIPTPPKPPGLSSRRNQFVLPEHNFLQALSEMPASHIIPCSQSISPPILSTPTSGHKQISPCRNCPDEQRAFSMRNRFSEFHFVASEKV